MKYNKIWKLLIILIVMNQYCICFFQSNYKKLLNKAKDYYKTKFKDKTWSFMDSDNSEYPGTNEQYRKINKQKWEEYYTCLNTQNSNIGKFNSIKPEAVAAFEGTMISFDCKLCISPYERDSMEKVKWYWGSLGSTTMLPIEYSEHITLSPADKTLHLYNLQDSQTGQYICQLGATLTAPYFLTVINSTLNIKQVNTEFAKRGPYRQKPDYIFYYNTQLVLDTIWTDWSHCGTCGKAGKRHKLGYCTIYIKDANTFNTTNKANIKLKRTQQEYANHEDEDDDSITEKDLELLNLFENGIPCLSHILPASIKQLPQVQNRTSEILVGYCRVPCLEDAIFQVKDKNGNIIETANNSAGIYSMLQGIPPIEPAIVRQLQYEKVGENIILSCPGNLNSDSSVQWQLGSKNLIPEIIAQQSMGRIYISVMDKIYIMKVKVSDSNIYSCWQNNNLAGTIRLVVENKIKMSFNHHIMLLGMVLILSVFVYVFGKAFLGRKYAI